MLVWSKRDASQLMGRLDCSRFMTLPETPQPIVRQPGPATVRLSELAAGRIARLHTADLAPQDCALLRAIGMTDRCVLRICKVGEPCIVEVRSTRIGLSRSVANGILVVPETSG